MTRRGGGQLGYPRRMIAPAPFVTEPAERARLDTIIQEIVEAVSQVTMSSPYELLDLALLRAYVAEIVPDDHDAGGAALQRAIELFAKHGADVGLFGGAARIGWTVAHLTDGETTDQVCASLDAVLLRQLAGDWTRDYDLIRGLVGLGVYALERGDAGHALAIRVLDQLERLARPRGAGVAWRTGPELLPPHQRAVAPHGYWNLGLAHGQSGVIALLARYLVRGLEPARTRRLLDAAVAFQLGISVAPDEHTPAWIADGTDQPSSADRLAWCYGDLGVGVALYAAGQAADHPGWCDRALGLARRCARLPLERTHVADAGLCHGAAGAAHVFHRLFVASGDAELGAATRTWLAHTLAIRNAEPIAGFPQRVTDGTGRWVPDASVLNGAPGVALVLAALRSETEPLWSRLLLTDLGRV